MLLVLLVRISASGGANQYDWNSLSSLFICLGCWLNDSK